MNNAEIFSEILDLQFPFCAAIKIELVFQFSIGTRHITIPRLGRLRALFTDG